MKNNYGIDVDYFKKELEMLKQSLPSRTPDELYRYLMCLANVAKPEENHSSKRQVNAMVIQPGCICQECGNNFTVDLNIPDNLWEKIKPVGKKDAGLLCGSCIMRKIEKTKGLAVYKLVAG